MSRFLRLDTAPSATSAVAARRSRGRSAIVDLVPLDLGLDPVRDNDHVFHNDHDEDDDDDNHDDLGVVRPSPTPSPPDSPGRQLAEFYLGGASHLLHNDDGLDLDPTDDHQEPAANDSLLDFPPTPSTVQSPHSTSNRSSIGSGPGAGAGSATVSHFHRVYTQPTSPLSSSSSSTAARRGAVPPPLPLPVQLQVQHQPDDDPFGFAVVERRIQLTRPYTQAPLSTAYSSKSPSVSVPPPSQRAPSSSLFSSTPTQQQQQGQELDSDMLPPQPMSPLSSLHLTADTPVRDSLDPTLHPPPFSATSPIQQQDSPPLAPLSPLSPAPLTPPSATATVTAPAPGPDTTDDDDDIFTFKPTSRAAQTQLRVTSAMHAALHPSTAAAVPKKYTRKARPVARMAKTKTEAKDVFEFADKDDNGDASAAAVQSKKKQPAVAKRKPRAPRKTQAPVQVTRFLGELIGVPSSSPSPPRRVPPPPQRVDHGFSSDVDAHPIAKPAPTKKAAAAPPKKRDAAAAKKPAPPAGAENVDPFALPEDPPGPAPSKLRGRGGAAAAARKKRTSAERVAEAAAAAGKHQGDEADEQGSPRKRTRTRTSGSGASAREATTAKRVTRSRRGAAAAAGAVEVEE